MPGVDLMGSHGGGLMDSQPISSQDQEKMAVLRSLEPGDIVSLMVRGYRPEGEIYRVYFLVSNSPLGSRRDAIFGYYEDEINDYLGYRSCVEFENIMAIERIAKRAAAGAIRDLISEKNLLRRKIDEHNKRVTDSWLIK